MMARQLSKMQKIIDEVRPNLVVIARSHCHPFYRPRATICVTNTRTIHMIRVSQLVQNSKKRKKPLTPTFLLVQRTSTVADLKLKVSQLIFKNHCRQNQLGLESSSKDMVTRQSHRFFFPSCTSHAQGLEGWKFCRSSNESRRARA